MKEEQEMKKETIQFAVKKKNGVVTQVGHCYMTQPQVKFKGGSVKWFDDSKLLKSTDNK